MGGNHEAKDTKEREMLEVEDYEGGEYSPSSISRMVGAPPLTQKAGFVYVMSNQYMPGLVKVGFTTRSPALRAQELSAPTGVPGQFFVEFYAEYANAKEEEGYFHQDNSESRIAGTEFFEVSVEYMYNVLSSPLSTGKGCRLMSYQEKQDAFDKFVEMVLPSEK
jgi:hypothetical protein